MAKKEDIIQEDKHEEKDKESIVAEGILQTSQSFEEVTFVKGLVVLLKLFNIKAVVEDILDVIFQSN